jgi:hypothetical protein
MKTHVSCPWLKSRSFDLCLILLPSVFSVVLVFALAHILKDQNGVSLWAWLIFILCIDVAHVYSTLFRTYFNSDEFRENQVLLTLIPVGVWLAGVALYSINPLIFWRLLAYVAVFHFIRQQYGFLRLYTRIDNQSRLERNLDALMIYVSTLYPILYWHGHQPRNFHWFIDGDFVVGLPPEVATVCGWFYLLLIIYYLINEGLRVRAGIPLNVPKNLVVGGTALSWYAGIVHFNGDLAFTITNVVSHGIPYMALVWMYGERFNGQNRIPYRIFFSRYSLPLFLGLLILFAYVEEGFWAGLVWREHLEVFAAFSFLPQITTTDTLSWLVPLLTLPQATHYILDGFIWKVRDSNANWQKVLFTR